MSLDKNMQDLLVAAGVEAQDFRPANTHYVVFSQTGERQVTFECTKDDKEISRFSISFLPGCRKVVVFHGVTVDPQYRNQGFGTLLHGFRLRIAQRVGAETAMCTVLSGNSIEKRILEHYGWTRMTTVSPNIEIWTNELKEAV